MGVVLETGKDSLLVETRNTFKVGDKVELIPFEGNNVAFTMDFIQTFDHKHITRTRPGMVVGIPPVPGASPMNHSSERVLHEILNLYRLQKAPGPPVLMKSLFQRGNFPASAHFPYLSHWTLAKEIRNLNKKAVFEWDILMTQTLWDKNLGHLCERLDFSCFDAVRVSDPGALQYLREKAPKCRIQLSLEGGNHNWRGIARWMELLGGQLEKIILSIELDRTHLKEYLPKIPVKTEILGLGPIPLYYSPRKLLSNIFSTDEATPPEGHKAWGRSEESIHRGFRLVENRHGTQMFHAKDLNLLGEKDFLENVQDWIT